jgi:hypothetical protein
MPSHFIQEMEHFEQEYTEKNATCGHFLPLDRPNYKSYQKQEFFMITNLNLKRFVLSIMAVLFLTSIKLPAYSSVTLVSADAIVVDPRRADMLNIADLYVHHHWSASETNLLKVYPYNYYDYTDPNTNITYHWLKDFDNTIKEINKDGAISGLARNGRLNKSLMEESKVHTPDWINVGEYVGVPYAWGISSPITDMPDNGKQLIIGPTGSFDQRIAAGLFAGNTDLL